MKLGSFVRFEAFGALFYDKRTGDFVPVSAELANLIAKADDETSLLDLLEDGEPSAMAAKLADLFAWQERGLLDAQFRCRVPRIANPPVEGALSAPLMAHVQMTSACNIACDYCYADITKKRGSDELSLEEWKALFAELAGMGTPQLIFGGGEPLFRKDTYAILEAATAAGLDSAICTNGMLLNEMTAPKLVATGVRWISVSLDLPGESAEGDRRYAKAVNGIRHIVAAGATDVQIRVTVTARNAPRLVEYAGIARDLGVHRVTFRPFRAAPTGVSGGAVDLIIGKHDYDAALATMLAAWPSDGPAVNTGDGMGADHPGWVDVVSDSACVAGTSVAAISPTGTVRACGFLKDEDDWSLRETSFERIWRSAPAIKRWRDPVGSGLVTLGGARGVRGCHARALARPAHEPRVDPWLEEALAVP